MCIRDSLLAILTLLFVALVASVLAGIGRIDGDQQQAPVKWVVGAAVVGGADMLPPRGGDDIPGGPKGTPA
mgnify:CR=1 FL=1